MTANVEMTEAGIAMPAMSVERPAPHEREHDKARKDRAEHGVDVDLVGGVDVARLVADDVQIHARGELGADGFELGLDTLDDRDGVGARTGGGSPARQRAAVEAGDRAAAPWFRLRRGRCRGCGRGVRR